MNDWVILRSNALVGTERRGQIDSTAIAGYDPADTDPARVLLNSASIVGAARRAGVRLGERDSSSRVSRAPGHSDELQAPGAAAQLLDLLLSGGIDGGATTWLVLHWMTSARAAGMVVPHAQLRSTLAWATSDVTRRSGVVEVLGTRGRWLASLNPTWSWAKAPSQAVLDADAWPSATHAERLAAFTSLRGRDPRRALALLELDWPTGSARQRTDFIEACAVGAGVADEQFLEGCLDDTSAAVRSSARSRLASIAGTDFTRRMGRRLEPLVGGANRGAGFVLNDPPEPDAEALRDGLGDPGGSPQLSLAHRRLAAIVAAAPLATWHASGLTAEACARHLPQPLLDSLAATVVRERDIGWGRALLRRTEHPAVVSVLGADAHEVLVERLRSLLRSKEASNTTVRHVWERHLAAVAAATVPWSRELSDAVVEFSAAGHLTAPALASISEAMVAGLHPQTASRLDTLIARHGADRNTARALSRLTSLISLRSAIDDAFAETSRTRP